MSSSDSDSEAEVPQGRGANQELDFDSNEIRTIVNDTVQYVITASQKKLPIKKANISKDCCRGRGRQFNQILAKVNKNLDDFFGMRLEAVPEKSTPMFILVNALDTVEMPFFEKSPDDHLLNGVLLPVLAVIFMLKGKVKEEIIWNFLKTLGLKVDDKHKFGPLHYSLKQLLTSHWVRQLYLEYSKDPESVAGEDPVYLFNWGFRAECEVNKKALLTFVSQVYDAHVQIETWHEQYDLALANHRLGEDDSMEN